MIRLTTRGPEFALFTIEYHHIYAGHFALESNSDEIAGSIRTFLNKHLIK